ncbi:MAG: hypothetical protein LBE36_13115 [Flavobacteriaceae bacterium]|jgi:polyhydroxyalkanoate synthesis regulator phasin|nr:hypothetical protein [Flavobacteriaceae bacterium]
MGEAKMYEDELERTAKLMDVPIDEIRDDIPENAVNQVFENVTGDYTGSHNVYPIPEFLLESQQKYITKLEEDIQNLKNEIRALKERLEKKN